MTDIGYQAFHGCTSMTSVNLSSTVERLEDSSFRYCRSLKSLVLPPSVTNIGYMAFQYCRALSSIECQAIVPPVGDSYMFDSTNNCPIYVPSPSVNAYKGASYWSDYADRINPMREYVDMGLSVKWAAYNLGASKPSERGGYYAWAEVEPRTAFTIKNYKYADALGAYTKYFSSTSSSGQYQLEAEDDAATVQWGEGWRMPTADECEELFDSSNCTYEHVTRDGVPGIELTSKRTGNKLFLPAGGRIYDETDINLDEGKYWTSTVDYTYNGVFALLFYNVGDLSVSFVSRYQGLLIRPVHK